MDATLSVFNLISIFSLFHVLISKSSLPRDKKKMKRMAPHRASNSPPLLCYYFHFIFSCTYLLSGDQRVLFAALVLLRVMEKVKRSDR